MCDLFVERKRAGVLYRRTTGDSETTLTGANGILIDITSTHTKSILYPLQEYNIHSSRCIRSGEIRYNGGISHCNRAILLLPCCFKARDREKRRERISMGRASFLLRNTRPNWTNCVQLCVHHEFRDERSKWLSPKTASTQAIARLRLETSWITLIAHITLFVNFHATFLRVKFII